MGKGKVKAKTATKANAKKADRLVEDKTFGMKNKKGAKAKKLIAQYQAQAKGGGKSQAYLEAQAAKKKAEKEQRKQAEREMLALLGEAYALDGKTGKKVKKKTAKKLQEDQAKKAEEEKEKQKIADEKDFGTPICALRDVFGLGSKATIERLCVEMTHKDNLPGKAADGQPCLFIKVADGTTLNPMTMSLAGETPQSFQFKVGNILDIRGAMAMVRGDKVLLELPVGTQGLANAAEGVEASMEVASERLSEFIKEKMEEEEAIRAKGGIPIEERIEEERANLTGPGTPVTKERFFAWKEEKKKKKEAALEEKRKDAAKKTGGKGLNVLTGRALFNYDQSLFVDDESALGGSELEKKKDEKASEEEDDEDDDEEEGDDTKETGFAEIAEKPPVPPSDAIQEDLYLEGDDDLDDLDDLDDDDEE